MKDGNLSLKAGIHRSGGHGAATEQKDPSDPIHRDTGCLFVHLGHESTLGEREIGMEAVNEQTSVPVKVVGESHLVLHERVCRIAHRGALDQ